MKQSPWGWSAAGGGAPTLVSGSEVGGEEGKPGRRAQGAVLPATGASCF